MGQHPERTLGLIHPSQQPTTTTLSHATSHITNRTQVMWPRMVAVPGPNGPQDNSVPQMATPKPAARTASDPGGTALRPVPHSAPLAPHGGVRTTTAPGRDSLSRGVVQLSPTQQAFVDQLEAKVRREKTIEQKYKPHPDEGAKEAV